MPTVLTVHAAHKMWRTALKNGRSKSFASVETAGNWQQARCFRTCLACSSDEVAANSSRAHGDGKAAEPPTRNWKRPGTWLQGVRND